MKKIIGFTMMALALVACGDKKSEEAPKAVTESKMPADCQDYVAAVEKLVAKSPDVAKQFQQSLESSKSQWENLSSEQAEAANKTCKQMLEQIKPML